MSYHQEIINHIKNQTFDLFLEWVDMQDSELRLKVFNDLRYVWTHVCIVHNIDPEDESMQVLNETIKKLEDLAVQKKVNKRISDEIEFSKSYIIEAIVNNLPHAAEMQELADAMIEHEKGMGTFDYNEWKEIL